MAAKRLKEQSFRLFGRSVAVEPSTHTHAQAADIDLEWEDSDHEYVTPTTEPVVDPWDIAGTTEARNSEKPVELEFNFDVPNNIDQSQQIDQVHGPYPDEADPQDPDPQGYLFDNIDDEGRPAENEAIQAAPDDEAGCNPIDDAAVDLSFDGELKLDDREEVPTPAASNAVVEDPEQIEFADGESLPADTDGLLDRDWFDEEPYGTVDDVEFEDFSIDVQPTGAFDSDIDISDFDEDARQQPWEVETEGVEENVRRARQKAATIASLLDVWSAQELSVSVSYLTNFFEHHRNAATFRALEKLALKGLDFETLNAMVELREVWMERPDWWVGRYSRGYEINVLPNGPSALTWVLAHRVCLARWNHTPAAMIDDQWLDEWLHLPHGAPGFLSFPSYIDDKTSNPDFVHHDNDFSVEGHSNGGVELANDYAWYRRVPHPDQTVRYGFNVITPYDDRPGRLTIAWRKEQEDDDD